MLYSQAPGLARDKNELPAMGAIDSRYDITVAVIPDTARRAVSETSQLPTVHTMAKEPKMSKQSAWQ